MGLIQHMVEEAGIPTISMGNMPDRMAHVKPPRALLVKFARGSMFGEPGNVNRQRRIILDGLDDSRVGAAAAKMLLHMLNDSLTAGIGIF